MNCRDIEPLILAERDGALTPAQHTALSAHIAGCPACRQMRLNFGEAVTFLKTDAANVPAPDADREWRRLQASLHGEAVRPAKKRPLAPVIWFGAPLAAAAALAIAFFVNRPETATVAPVQVAGHAATAEAAASTIAYVDQDSGWLVVWTTEDDTKSRG